MTNDKSQPANNNTVTRHSPLAARTPQLIAATFFILALIYSIVTPIFESPDELWHYPLVWHLAHTAQLPVQDPANPQLWQQEGSQPPLYYALAALLTAPIPTADLPALIYPNPHADIGRVSADGNANIVVHTPREAFPWQGAVLAIHLARLFSVVLATGTVLTVYALSRALWPHNLPFALIAMAFVAFNPMFIFIAGSVNNDNLITLLAGLILWRLIVLVSGQVAPRPEQFVALGLLIGAALLAKVSGLGLLGLTGLMLLGWGVRQKSWRIAVGYNALVGGLALGVAGWWYWRNWQLYGDPTGTQIMVQMMGARPVDPSWRQLLSEVPGLLRSFWGLFGYFSVPLPVAVYGLLNGLLCWPGAAGWLLIAGRRNVCGNSAQPAHHLAHSAGLAGYFAHRLCAVDAAHPGHAGTAPLSGAGCPGSLVGHRLAGPVAAPVEVAARRADAGRGRVGAVGRHRPGLQRR